MSERRRPRVRRSTRAPYDSRDVMVLGAAAAAAAVCALVAQFGGVPQAAAARRPDRHHGDRVRAVDQPARDRPADGRLGAGAAGRLRAARAQDRGRPGACSRRSARAINRLLDFAFVGSSFVFGPLGDKEVWPRIMTTVLGRRGRAVRRHLRVPGAADDHLHRRAVRHPLLLRRHAGRRAAVRGGDAAGHARVGRRVAQRRGQHLHGADRGAADHPAVPAADDRVGADDGHDRRAWRTSPAASWRPTSCSASRRSIC